MAETVVKPRSLDQPTHDLASEVGEIRQRCVEQAAENADADASPQAFFERSTAPEDVRAILKRLAVS